MSLTIRPYQADGLEFLVSHRRAALFDEPGLGKTMQALLSMRDLVPKGRILVVATGDAVGVWQDEIARWLDEPVSVFAGTKATMDALHAEGFVITNYSRLATALGLGPHWDGVIFDESQMLRNRKTRTLFHAVKAAFDRRAHGLQDVPAFFLSGTPVVKAAGDLWPILHTIDKVRWSSYWKFVQRYCIVWEDQFGWHVEGITNAKGLWEELSSVCLRRTVAEVQPSLPEKVRQRVPLKMTARQARAYRQLETDMIAEVDSLPAGSLLLAPSVLALETRLRQLLACPRLLDIDDDGAAVFALAEVAATNPRPFVVFTPFPSAIPYLKAALCKVTNRPMFTARGGMGAKLAEAIAVFKDVSEAWTADQLSDEAPILFASVQMSKSWSVAEATHEAYFLEFDWNATTQMQAESRLHRPGQSDTVFARYFVHEGTHDFDALDVLSGKKRLADVILDRARKVVHR
jgi:SWI/SNF-related matrix-associated actin-dependent regulator 1 of chromatin subfamily A